MAQQRLDPRLVRLYRKARAHQLATWGNSGVCIDGRDLREFTGGGAAYGHHAIAAYRSARSTIHFLKTHPTEEK